MKKVDIVKETNDEGKEIVKSINLIETYQDNKGKYTSIFYYKIDKKFGIAYDDDAFCKITIDHENEIDYNNFNENIMKSELALQLLGLTKDDDLELNKDKFMDAFKHIYVITKKEYEKETEE